MQMFLTVPAGHSITQCRIVKSACAVMPWSLVVHTAVGRTFFKRDGSTGNVGEKRVPRQVELSAVVDMSEVSKREGLPEQLGAVAALSIVGGPPASLHPNLHPPPPPPNPNLTAPLINPATKESAWIQNLNVLWLSGTCLSHSDPKQKPNVRHCGANFRNQLRLLTCEV